MAFKEFGFPPRPLENVEGEIENKSWRQEFPGIGVAGQRERESHQKRTIGEKSTKRGLQTPESLASEQRSSLVTRIKKGEETRPNCLPLTGRKKNKRSLKICA